MADWLDNLDTDSLAPPGGAVAAPEAPTQPPGLVEKIARYAVPFGSVAMRGLESQDYGIAKKRVSAGKGDPGDTRTIAEYEGRQQAEANEGPGGKFVTGVLHLPAIVGEFGAAGGLAGGAEGATVAVPRFFSMATVKSAVGRLVSPTALGRAAALTPAVPSMYVDKWTQDNLANGREALDPRGFPSAYALGVLQTHVLGAVTGAGRAIPGEGLGPWSQRLAAAAATGTGGAEAASITASAASEVLPKAYKLETGYGALGDAFQGKWGAAGERLAVELGIFSLFGAIHAHGKGPFVPENVEMPAAGPHPGMEGPQPPPGIPPGMGGRATPGPTAESPPVLKAWQAWTREAKGMGLSANDAVKMGLDMFEQVHKHLDRNPDASRGDVWKLFEGMDKGKLKDFGRALADQFPETAEEAGGREWKGVRQEQAPGRPPEAPPEPPDAEVVQKPAGELEGPEQAARRKLMTSKKWPDVSNRLAMEETGPAESVALTDVDQLGSMPKEKGDAVVRGKIDALREAGLEPYHAGQDEFLVKDGPKAEMQAKLEAARQKLQASHGADFSYGIGKDMKGLDEPLRDMKEAKKAPPVEPPKPGDNLRMKTAKDIEGQNQEGIGPYGFKDLSAKLEWEAKDAVEEKHPDWSPGQVETEVRARLAKENAKGDWAVIADTQHASQAGVWSWHGSEAEAHRAMMQAKQDHEHSGVLFSVKHRDEAIRTPGVEEPPKPAETPAEKTARLKENMRRKSQGLKPIEQPAQEPRAEPKPPEEIPLPRGLEPAQGREPTLPGHAGKLTPVEEHVRAAWLGGDSLREIMEDPQLAKLWGEGRQPSRQTVKNWLDAAHQKLGGEGSLAKSMKGEKPQPSKEHLRKARSEAEDIHDEIAQLGDQLLEETKNGSRELEPDREQFFRSEGERLNTALSQAQGRREAARRGNEAGRKSGVEAPVQPAAGGQLPEVNPPPGPPPAEQGAGPSAPEGPRGQAAPGGFEAPGDKLTPEEISDGNKAFTTRGHPPLSAEDIAGVEKQAQAEALAQVEAESRAAAARAAQPGAPSPEPGAAGPGGKPGGPAEPGPIGRAIRDVAEGAKKFAEADAGSLNLQAISEWAQKKWDDVKKVFSPAARGPEAKIGAGIIRANLAQKVREGLVARTALAAGERYYEDFLNSTKNPVHIQGKFLEFTDAIESGNIASLPPEIRPFAQTIRDLLDGREKQLVDRGLINHTIENYLGHLWEKPGSNPQDLGAMLGKRPMAGQEGFRKQRVLATYRAGIDAGLTPRTWNPITNTLLLMDQIDKSIMHHDIMEELDDNGLRQYVRLGASAPPGWTRLQDKTATQFAPPVQPGGAGPQLVGHYYMPEPVTRLLENYLMPGLRGNALYDLPRQFGNTMNMFQLGFSTFHLIFTGLDSQISAAALALQYASRGKTPPASVLAQAAIPLAAPISRLLEGSKILQEYFKPGSQSPEVADMVNALIMGGGRAKMDQFYQNDSLEAFRKSLSQLRAGQAEGGLGMLVHALPGIAEAVSYPVMQMWVPRLKLGVFADMARYELGKLPPGSGPNERMEALGRAWDSVENRMGQLTYDNLFWGKIFKDSLMLSVRSTGWNVGSLREMGGGVADIPSSLGGLPKGKGISPRLAYILALPAITAIYGALYQYLRTGKGPEETKDLFAPKTGNKNKDGTDERIQIPTYMRDVMAFFNRADEGPTRWVQNVGEMAKGKLSPGVTVPYEAVFGQDFQGAAIRNPNDPAYKQALDTAMHVMQGYESFSLKAYLEQTKKGRSPAEALQGMLGVTPAPSRLTHTWEQQRRMETGRRYEMTPQEKRRRLGMK